MSYINDREGFIKDYNTCLGTETGGKMPAEVAYSLYQNTYNAALPFLVFGRHKFAFDGTVEKAVREGKDIHLAAQGIGSMEEQNFGTANEFQSTGIILSTSRWNITVNDTWVLAGIHALKEFQSASPVNSINIFGVDPNHPVTVTGRELLGLALFGYSDRSADKFSRGYACTDTFKAENATLIKYKSEMDQIQTPGQAQKTLADNGISVEP